MSDNMQKDLVLSPNEYSYVLDQTKGNISCWVGPSKTSLSQSDVLVKFNEKSKKFVPCREYSEAIQLFCSAPEGWYISLKNPAPDNKHPNIGASNSIPENMQIGCKVNIPGPVNFALYPGQMAQVIRGHSLRSNQYLVAKVYDADILNAGVEYTKGQVPYFNGQTLIIKGTEVSFYIPPTGIEVKPIENNPNKGYVRDAVTLERLEYCILKDENGKCRYAHGPEVVFPTPTESFIQDGNNHIKRKAIELSEISGIYIKVIVDYKDEDGKEHKTGEELFITGKDQMIYYPRPEHTFITYNGRTMHHAIAIPKGEGRYIMNRITGDIRTVRGPAMYLPDPRAEVAIKRVLTRSQCELWYPGNNEVLEANGYGYGATADTEQSMSKNIVGTFADPSMCVDTAFYYNGTPTKKEKNSINRSNTYIQPRTICLNSSKYEGAVAVDVWTGYAVNVLSKDGSREVIKGPKTILLDYDQTLETLKLSTGKPKTADNLEYTAFLRYENNRVSDIINVETSDFVHANIKVSYNINFDEDMVDKWFSIDNYVQHMCEWCRSAIKKIAKGYTLADFHANYHDILPAAITDEGAYGYLHKFNENGMIISDIEILSIQVDAHIQRLINNHQESIVSRALDLTAAQNSVETERQLTELHREGVKLNEEFRRFRAESEAATAAKEYALKVEAQKVKDTEDKRKYEIMSEIQALKDIIAEAELERRKREQEAERAHQEQMAELEMKREAHSAEAMRVILSALGPELAMALNNQNNQDTVRAIAESIAPYAIAGDKSVSEAVSTLLRGTTLEQVLKTMEQK